MQKTSISKVWFHEWILMHNQTIIIIINFGGGDETPFLIENECVCNILVYQSLWYSYLLASCNLAEKDAYHATIDLA